MLRGVHYLIVATYIVLPVAASFVDLGCAHHRKSEVSQSRADDAASAWQCSSARGFAWRMGCSLAGSPPLRRWQAGTTICAAGMLFVLKVFRLVAATGADEAGHQCITVTGRVGGADRAGGVDRGGGTPS